jgi:hypothetical protein
LVWRHRLAILLIGEVWNRPPVFDTYVSDEQWLNRAPVSHSAALYQLPKADASLRRPDADGIAFKRNRRYSDDEEAG